MREETTIPRLPDRRADAHKNDFGRAVIFGGSVGMIGAAILAARGALRSGAGLVELIVPEGAWSAAAGVVPGALVKPMKDAREAAGFLRGATAAGMGPGMGRQGWTPRAVADVLAAASMPVVLDADALAVVAAEPSMLATCRAPIILTPHAGEMARLCGKDRAAVQADRLETAAEFARSHRALVVLKGAGTIVTDGNRFYRNTTGGPGLARGGTGDILTGILTALLAQNFMPMEAAILATCVHGTAGDIAAAEKGVTGMTAEDVVEALPRAWLKRS